LIRVFSLTFFHLFFSYFEPFRKKVTNTTTPYEETPSQATAAKGKQSWPSGSRRKRGYIFAAGWLLLGRELLSSVAGKCIQPAKSIRALGHEPLVPDLMFSLLAAFAAPDGVGAMPTFVSAPPPLEYLPFSFSVDVYFQAHTSDPEDVNTSIDGCNRFESLAFPPFYSALSGYQPLRLWHCILTSLWSH